MLIICNDNGFPGGASGKEPASNAGDLRDSVQSLGWEVPWRRKWQTIPVFLSGESHGQKSLASYSPSGLKESDVTEVTENAHIKIKTKDVFY